MNKQTIRNKLRISREIQDLAILCVGSATEIIGMSLAYSICVKFILPKHVTPQPYIYDSAHRVLAAKPDP